MSLKKNSQKKAKCTSGKLRYKNDQEPLPKLKGNVRRLKRPNVPIFYRKKASTLFLKPHVKSSKWLFTIGLINI